jgi:hypothetical protein
MKPFSRPFLYYFCYGVQAPLAGASSQSENGGLLYSALYTKCGPRQWTRVDQRYPMSRSPLLSDSERRETIMDTHSDRTHEHLSCHFGLLARRNTLGGVRLKCASRTINASRPETSSHEQSTYAINLPST